MITRRAWFKRSSGAGALLSLLLGLGGCSRSEAPTPIELGQIPTVLRESFKEAKEPVAGLVNDLVGAVEAREWPKASVAVQALSGAAGLSAKQREAVARCLMTINTQVSEAAAAGNPQAEEIQRMIRQDK